MDAHLNADFSAGKLAGCKNGWRIGGTDVRKIFLMRITQIDFELVAITM